MSTECKALKKSSLALIKCFEQSPDDITDQLRPLGILAPGNLKALENPYHNKDEKARIIYEAVHTQVQTDPQVFHKFVFAIRNAGQWTKIVVDQLEDAYRDSQDSDSRLNARLGEQLPCEHSSTISFSESINRTVESQSAIGSQSGSPWPLTQPCNSKIVEGLNEDSSDIERKFGKLVASILKSLMTQNISKDRLVACLMGFNSLKKVYNDGSQQSIFRTQRKNFNDPNSTLETVWIITGEYYSFFDYDILEVIVDTLGCENDKEDLAKYKEDFKDYAKRRLFIDHSSSNISIGPNGEKHLMYVKLDNSFDECEIGHLKTLQKKLSDILNVTDGVLQLRQVSEGCIQLLFNIPEFISEVVFPLSSDQEAALQELRVTKLDCGDYHFIAAAKEEKASSSRNDSENDSGDPPSDPPLSNSVTMYGESSQIENYDHTVTSYDGKSSSDIYDHEEQATNDTASTLSFEMNYPLKSKYSTPAKCESFHSDSGIGTSASIRSQLEEIDHLGDMALGKDNQYIDSEQLKVSKLHSAVFNGELTRVRLLVEVFHCNPLEVNRYGLTALHTAAISGDLNLLKYFTEDHQLSINAASAESKDENCTTSLHWAAQHGHLHIVEYLVEDQLINPLLLDGRSRTPLHAACAGGHLNTVKYLVDKGRTNEIIKDVKTKHGRTFLHFAAWSGNLSVVSYILAEFYQDNESDVNKRDEKEVCALHFASNTKREVVQLLLLSGAQPDSSSIDGLTPLMIAARCGSFSIAECLIAAKAKIDSQDSCERSSALHWASYEGHLDIVQLLIDEEADVNIQTETTYTPLMVAAQEGHTSVLEILIHAGAHHQTQQQDGCTALHLAAARGHSECVQLFLRNGTSVNARANLGGHTPLMVAAIEGHLSVLEKLIAEEEYVMYHQADDGSTALHFAAARGHSHCVQFLIQKGADVHVTNKYGHTPLLSAAQEGQLSVSVLEILIAGKANIHYQAYSDGCTALHLAALGGYSHCMKFLLDKGADVHMTNKGGNTALHLAAAKGHSHCVKFLIQKGADVHMKNEVAGCTALHLAFGHGHLECVQPLTENGASLHTKVNHPAVSQRRDDIVCYMAHGDKDVQSFRDGSTALHLAADGGHSDCVQFLIQKGADVGIKNNRGDTALHVAAAKGHTKCAELLIRNGASVNARDKMKHSPLMLAAQEGQHSVVELLIAEKANLHYQAIWDGNTALHLAAAGGHTHCVQLLIQKGADVRMTNYCSKDGSTALHSAAFGGNSDCVQFLILKGADVCMKNKRGDTALHIAAAKGHPKCAELLIINGASVNDQAIDGSTALHLAALGGNSHCVQSLIQKGADVRIKNKNGDTALHIAASKEDPKCAQVLIQNGASVNARDKVVAFWLPYPLYHCRTSFIDTSFKTLILSSQKHSEIVFRCGYDWFCGY